MSFYYSANIILCWLTLGTLGLLVHENGRLKSHDKRLLYITYALIALSASAEYMGVFLDGRQDFPPQMLQFVKCADYILTPMAGGALVYQMRLKNKWRNVLAGLLVFNTVFQLISVFGGWMIKISEDNHYVHGPAYVFYIGIYLLIILIVLMQFNIYAHSLRRQNRMSLYATMLLIIIGALIQELSGREARTTYIALTFGALLLFIQYAEYDALEMDDFLRRQQFQIDTDPLTGVLSRAAYSRVLQFYREEELFPVDLAAFTIDINGLKRVNDTLGHEAGDELICGAANCIVKALNARESCYRIGGDEFVVLKSMNREEAERALDQLKWEADHWCGTRVKSLSLSVGCALSAEYEDKELSVEMLIRESDRGMYEAKAAYYRTAGKDRSIRTISF